MSGRTKGAPGRIWLLLSPLLAYAVVSELVLFAGALVYGSAWEEKLLSGSTLSAALSCALLGVWYRQELVRGRVMHGPVQKPTVRSVGIVVTGAVGACLFANHLLILAEVPSSGFDAVKESLYRPSLAVQVLGTGLLIPFAEELVFRGLGYGRLRRELPFGQAACLTALLFGLYHGNLIQGIYAAFLGFMIAMAYETCGGLWAAWLFHAAANLTSVLLTASSAAVWLQAERGRMAAALAAGGLLAAGSILKMREEIN